MQTQTKLSARASPESGGSGPAYDFPGMRSMNRRKPASALPRSARATTLFQRVLQLGEEIVDAFNADRQAHQAVVDAKAGAHIFG